MIETIVVTRHAALVDYLKEIGAIDEKTKVVEHATVGDVTGRNVVGVLPYHLGRHAETVSEVPLILTPDDRGKELTLERIKEVALPICTYQVRLLEGPEPKLGMP